MLSFNGGVVTKVFLKRSYFIKFVPKMAALREARSLLCPQLIILQPAEVEVRHAGTKAKKNNSAMGRQVSATL